MDRVKKKKKARQNEIYATAAELFANKGYHATRIQDIANQLGMRKGSLYYYFATKEELLARVTEGRIEEMLAAMEAIIATNHTPTQKLTLAIDEHLRLYKKHANIFAIFTQENLAEISVETAKVVRTVSKKYQSLWKAILQEGIERGEFQEGLDLEITMQAILGMCNHTLIWYKSEGRLEIREIARLFAQLIISGIQTA